MHNAAPAAAVTNSLPQGPHLLAEEASLRRALLPPDGAAVAFAALDSPTVAPG